jgi:thiosulfate/3-mercaptopyruvate sulfurtransferase
MACVMRGIVVWEYRYTMADSISTQELAAHLDDPDVVIVDVREMPAFNGWRLHGEARGGHIPGAVACPWSWLSGAAEPVIKRGVAAKGVTPDKTVVVYARQRDHSRVMATLLDTWGYSRVRIYNAGLVEWAADAALPMEHLAHYDQLVHPFWLYQMMFAKRLDPGSGCLLLEVSAGPTTTYDTGHIPGALSFSTERVESAPLWNRISDDALEEVLVSYGMTYDTTVVLYGRDTTAAARVASLLLYAGVDDVRLLDGGLTAWLAAGYPVEITPRSPTPCQTFGRPVPGQPHYMIDTEEIHAMLADEDASLVSIRSWHEHIGATSGYSYIQPKGRIAGTIWGGAGSAPHRMDHYRHQDNTMRSYPEMATNWHLQGIHADRRVAFYCGTGWRASEAFFYAYLMGWRRIAVYDGGWLEWSQKPSHPIAMGPPVSLVS